MVWRVIGASGVHGRVGAFYAPYAREGNQILQMKPFTSVDTIRGYASISNRSKHRKIPSLAPLKNQGIYLASTSTNHSKELKIDVSYPAVV
jgi:hypothetical protein